jgi:hypothetical protein
MKVMALEQRSGSEGEMEADSLCKRAAHAQRGHCVVWMVLLISNPTLKYIYLKEKY